MQFTIPSADMRTAALRDRLQMPDAKKSAAACALAQLMDETCAWAPRVWASEDVWGMGCPLTWSIDAVARAFDVIMDVVHSSKNSSKLRPEMRGWISTVPDVRPSKIRLGDLDTPTRDAIIEKILAHVSDAMDAARLSVATGGGLRGRRACILAKRPLPMYIVPHPPMTWKPDIVGYAIAETESRFKPPLDAMAAEVARSVMTARSIVDATTRFRNDDVAHTDVCVRICTRPVAAFWSYMDLGTGMRLPVVYEVSFKHETAATGMDRSGEGRNRMCRRVTGAFVAAKLGRCIQGRRHSTPPPIPKGRLVCHAEVSMLPRSPSIVRLATDFSSVADKVANATGMAKFADVDVPGMQLVDAMIEQETLSALRIAVVALSRSFDGRFMCPWLNPHVQSFRFETSHSEQGFMRGSSRLVEFGVRNPP